MNINYIKFDKQYINILSGVRNKNFCGLQKTPHIVVLVFQTPSPKKKGNLLDECFFFLKFFFLLKSFDFQYLHNDFQTDPQTHLRHFKLLGKLERRATHLLLKKSCI